MVIFIQMHRLHPSRLYDLRTFLRNDSATFKDPQQALALKLICGKEPSLLLIGVLIIAFLEFVRDACFKAQERRYPFS